jgi:hypothetical protein
MAGNISHTAFPMRRARRSRVLAYLLLFLISYGSSTEIFHHHGFASGKKQATSANLVSDGGTSKSSNKIPLERDCLVCQFQRGLFSTTIFGPLLLLAPTSSHHTHSAAPVSLNSLSTTASRGRAPPTSL